MEGNARTWFTPKQRAELWERWKSGQCVADIARALERRNQERRLPGLGCQWRDRPIVAPDSCTSAEACGTRRDLAWHCHWSVDTADRTGTCPLAVGGCVGCICALTVE